MSEPAILLLLEKTATLINSHREGMVLQRWGELNRSDALLLRELRDVLSRAIVRGNELDPETQRKLVEILEDRA